MLFGVGCQKESSDANSDAANITVAPETISTTIAGGEYELTVTSNASWSASCDQAGVEFTPKEGVGNGTVKVVIPEKATLPFDITFNATKKATMNGIEYDSPASATVHVQNANAKTYFEETFEESQGEFTINDVVLGEGLTYVWNHENGQYGYYMKASAYKDGAKSSESWLISPEISLVGAAMPAVSFEHCHKFAGTPSEELTLWISENGGQDWAQLTIPAYGSNNDYTFVANTIDITAYAGKNIKIAFKYVATATHAGTWEVHNVKVAEGDGTSTEPSQPGQGGNDKPVEGSYTMIDRVANISAGKYLMAGYSESYTNTTSSETTTFAPYSYHFWVGSIATSNGNKDLVTKNYSYTDGDLTANPSSTVSGHAAEVELVAVDGKADTFYIKYNGQYLTCTGKRAAALVDTAVEWTFSDHSKGGIQLVDSTGNSSGVILGTAGAQSNMLRCYVSPANSLVYGVAFFKKN